MKTGKSTICSQAPKPVFLMTENGGEGLTGFTPIPIGSWSDFKQAVNQLCSPRGREFFDTVVIDTYTNLILLLDKYVGAKLSTDNSTMDFGSDADYGKGTRSIRNELGIQLQKLSNQGYLLLNIVHAEDKVDFKTGKEFVGTSLSTSLFGVCEKFVDQIIYLKREKVKDKYEYRTYFHPSGGFENTGGRFSPEEQWVPTSYNNVEAAMLKAIEKAAVDQGAEKINVTTPSITIDSDESLLDFPSMMAEFKEIANTMVSSDPEGAPAKITAIVERELGVGKKVGNLTSRQAELLANIIANLKQSN